MSVLSMLGEVVLNKSSKTSKRSKREAYLMLKEDRLLILRYFTGFELSRRSIVYGGKGGNGNDLTRTYLKFSQ